MAEFQKVAKEYIRMCESFECNCKLCPLNSSANDIYVCRNNIIKNSVKYEYAIMQWAAEHPEPVYPTWEEWLGKQGVLDYRGDYNPVTKHIDRFLNSKAKNSIPTDIAQKLGITPKESN